CTTGNSWFAYW
nr:immunoglobulin heavy chain junction region [Mus musculus]